MKLEIVFNGGARVVVAAMGFSILESENGYKQGITVDSVPGAPVLEYINFREVAAVIRTDGPAPSEPGTPDWLADERG